MKGAALSQQDVLTGELLDGKYRIGKLLGQGGMGAVYRATHLGTKRTVAVKVIRPRLSASREFVERFRREAEAAGRLRHPNVVDVTDFGLAQIGSSQVGYLVMEYLDGCTLAEVLAEEPRLPTGWVVDILEQMCSAVDEAHRLGMQVAGAHAQRIDRSSVARAHPERRELGAGTVNPPAGRHLAGTHRCRATARLTPRAAGVEWGRSSESNN
jgi:serine/threonine protein kinase